LRIRRARQPRCQGRDALRHLGQGLQHQPSRDRAVVALPAESRRRTATETRGASATWICVVGRQSTQSAGGAAAPERTRICVTPDACAAGSTSWRSAYACPCPGRTSDASSRTSAVRPRTPVALPSSLTDRRTGATGSARGVAHATSHRPLVPASPSTRATKQRSTPLLAGICRKGASDCCPAAAQGATPRKYVASCGCEAASAARR
jgi:hypothetical protein